MKKIIIILTLFFGIFLIVSMVPRKQLVSVHDDTSLISSPISIGLDEGASVDTLSLQETLREDAMEELPGFRNPDKEICVGEYCDGSMSGEEDITVLNIPMITSLGDIGCGSGLIFAPHTVTKTTAVLDATYKTLFELKPQPEIITDGVRNIVGYEDRLFYEEVVLEEGVAKVYLAGVPYKIYNCTIPEFQAQIERAALQFESVDVIEVYLNNKLWDWCQWSEAEPEEDGCNTTPKYWRATS